ncbi:hypothetical protein BJ508DRAFT_53638 [Ascobolus immersus RN42]|uniref:Uncharacterized protein n=1 Tax=Ascobolus immersus RN42 TaxID=1160509 RepID=A0A3N4HGN1_ASCIM|nr:hypothetical protein BJ508DRAFT_53638 [Ascobolus immersus RN42]
MKNDRKKRNQCIKAATREKASYPQAKEGVNMYPLNKCSTKKTRYPTIFPFKPLQRKTNTEKDPCKS